jgi:hypothetical protein
MTRKKLKNRFPDYDVVDLKKMGIITFGTRLFIRKDKQALKIVFPTGQTVTFCPTEEIQENDIKIKPYDQTKRQ